MSSSKPRLTVEQALADAVWDVIDAKAEAYRDAANILERHSARGRSVEEIVETLRLKAERRGIRQG